MASLRRSRRRRSLDQQGDAAAKTHEELPRRFEECFPRSKAHELGRRRDVRVNGKPNTSKSLQRLAKVFVDSRPPLDEGTCLRRSSSGPPIVMSACQFKIRGKLATGIRQRRQRLAPLRKPAE